MRKICLMIMLLIMCMVGYSIASDPIIEVEGFVKSEYDFYGYDVFDDHAVYGGALRFNVPELPVVGDGVYLDVTSYFPIGRGNELIEADYGVGYEFSLLSDTVFQLDADVHFAYMHIFNEPGNMDAYEFVAYVEVPNAIDVFGNDLVPSVAFVNLLDVDKERDNTSANGRLYVGGLEYRMNIYEDQTLNIGSFLTFNDGAFESDSDWSHCDFVASTDFDITSNVSLSPFIGYQVSMEDTVNTEDGFKGGASVKIVF
jgi:hypothetical protein